MKTTGVQPKLLASLVTFAERNGVAAASFLGLVRGELGYDDPAIEGGRVVGERVPWAVMAAASDVFVSLFPEALRERYFDEMFGSPADWTIAPRRIAALLTSPATLYKVILSWITPIDVPNVQLSVEPLADGCLRVRIWLRDSDRDSRGHFVMSATALRKLPRMMALADATVEAKIAARQGIYDVTLPPSHTLWSRLGRRLRMLSDPDSVTRELVLAGELLRDRYDELARANALLEDKVRERTHELAQANADLESLVAELREATARADAASRMKSLFLANMSHEIRTPLTAVLGFAEILAQGTLPEERRRAAIETILRNGHHLNDLLSGVLDLAKIESGSLTLNLEPSSPAAEVTSAVRQLQGLAMKKGITIGVELATDIPARVVLDPLRLRQIVINLISNAVKFTSHGRVVVRGRAAEKDGTQAFEILVEDTGEGIPASRQHELFAPFVQLGDDAPRAGGTGLGLALSRRLAREMGGDVELVASEPGRGSTFRLVLPVVAPGAWPQRADAGEAEPPLGGVRILVAEDNPDVRFLILEHLRAAGGDARAVEDGESCLASVAADPPDLVILDVQMPVRDGLSTARELRRRGFRRPLLAVTAFATAADREICVAAGVDEVLAKPITAATLCATVARLVASRFRPK